VRKLGLEDRKILTYIGRLNQRKGLDALLRAFCLIAKRRKDVALLFIGEDDGYQRTLERLVTELSPSSPVLFLGLITHPLKLSALRDSDAIVYPGHHEIFGLVPFEALMCGTPVVVADDSGCGEIIHETGAGLTVPFGSVEALRDAIEVTLEAGIDVVERTKRGREF